MVRSKMLGTLGHSFVHTQGCIEQPVAEVPFGHRQGMVAFVGKEHHGTFDQQVFVERIEVLDRGQSLIQIASVLSASVLHHIQLPGMGLAVALQPDHN